MTMTADRPRNSSYACMSSIYVRLLADIEEKSGVPLGAPDDFSYEWMLKEAPKLDKTMLVFLEGGGEQPSFPEWLMPLWNRFLSSMDGKYLRWIRQCLLFCYKTEYEPTNEQLQEAQKAFEESDSDVGVWDSHFIVGNPEHSPLFTTARQIVGRCIYKINWSDILPKHGPGAVYPSKKPCDKSRFSVIYSSIDQKYPFADYFCGLPNYWDDVVVRGDKDIKVLDSIVCNLVAVPKDSRGPRLISVHPCESIWIQQGCRSLLERAIEHPRSPCFGKINFSDQGVNGRLALQSSLDREYCTLDLREASDRISCNLVKFLFGEYAYNYISCSRADKIRLFDNRVIPLKKWAPMGNALTFPVQSLVFYSLVRAGIRCRYGIDCRDIYVFGDDILFPTQFYDGAIGALVSAGLIPNVSKTFRHGFFRESCGVDAFKGINVTPHRLRRMDASSYSGAMSICTLAKAMCLDGYPRTSGFLYRLIEESCGRLPLGNNPLAQGLYRYEKCTLDKLLRYEPTIVFNRKLHIWQTRVLLVDGVNYHLVKHAWWHVQDSLLRLHSMSGGELRSGGLEYPVPHRTRLKRGWTEALW